MKKTLLLTPLLSIGFVTVFLLSCTSDNSNTSELQSIPQDPGAKYPHELLDTLTEAPLIFYNVENLFDTIDDPEKKDEDFLPGSKKKWSSTRYYDKLEKLAEVIEATSPNNPVFVGLAEIENRFVVQDLMTTGRLASTKYRIAHFESPDVRGIDVALAFDHRKFHMTHKEAIEISIAEEPNFKTRDILYVKGVFYDSSEVHIFVNHWSSRRGGQEKSEHKRIKAAKTLKAKVDSLLGLNSDANIIIMGDFNDYPDNISISQHLDARSSEVQSTLKNLLLSQHEEGKGTHNYKGEWGALDQIIVSEGLLDESGLNVKRGEAKILYDERFLYTQKDGSKTPNRTFGGNSYFGGYSDHLAIYSILTLARK